MNKNKMHFLVGLISCTFMSTAIVLCLTNFKVSKLNACPSQDSKFLSLTERSLEQCVEECARKKSCEVVGYKRSFRLCEIHVDSPSPDVDDNRCVMIKKTDMSGPPSKCTNCGEWSACDEETGHCSREECPLLTTVANGTVLGNMNDFGAKKIVRCNTGFFEITGTHSVKCSAKGEWTPRYDRNPHCQNFSRYWTDGTKDIDGKWKYTNSLNISRAEQFWNQRENDNGNCVQINQWLSAVPCDQKLHFICEFD